MASASRSIAEVPATEFFTFKECQDLIRQRLHISALRLFRELTGLSLHALWHDALEFQDAGRQHVPCPVMRRRGDRPRRSVPVACTACLRERWRRDSAAVCHGRQFRGRCGTRFFWAGVQVDGVWPVTLVVEAATVDDRFRRAVALLRLVLHDLQTTLDLGSTRRALELARRRVKSLETEGARLQRQLVRQAPRTPASRPQARRGSHRQQIVETMVNYIHAHYQQSIHLDEVAAALELNSSYLCSLFSGTMGVTFHQYLDELRLVRAKELLRNPTTRVYEVAAEVGYASGGCFSRAFKAHVGLSPSAWREGGEA